MFIENGVRNEELNRSSRHASKIRAGVPAALNMMLLTNTLASSTTRIISDAALPARLQ
jgi:hypothetical protein